jgi:pimeloyl-ACP methyl ester carboxylesterase
MREQHCPRHALTIEELMSKTRIPPSRTVLLIHGAFAGAWCFDAFAEPLRARGFTCHAPNLPHHGNAGEAAPGLAGSSVADYARAMADFARALPEKPIIVGHSMGGLIAQQLAAAGLAHALVLLASAAPWGMPPTSDLERRVAVGLMSTGPFWTRALQPSFDVAKLDALASVPSAGQRAIFDHFGAESGRALFELFFWMFDDNATTRVNPAAVKCPILVINGADDRVIAATTGRRIADLYGAKAQYRELAGRGHFLPMEPGWEELAAACAEFADAADG